MRLAGSQPFHFFLQAQLFALKAGQGFAIRLGSQILLKNALFKGGVTVIEGSNPGIQAHTEASFAVMRPGRLALSRAALSC
jgi:hypothetical protein